MHIQQWGQQHGPQRRKMSQSASAVIAVEMQRAIAPVHVDEYDDVDMMAARDELNAVKSRIDEYYERSQREWNIVSNALDLYRGLRSIIERKYGGQYVTNASLKYYELFAMYPPITASGRVVAFFNAELPGAALCAFNAQMHGAGIPFEWYASSYVPVRRGATRSADTTALEDQYGLYAHNRDRWLMSARNDGDMTRLDNIIDIESRIGPASMVGGVTFYSHDAGIDASSDYNRQESMNALLHLGCALAGFVTMRGGATFVAKQYTCFETPTWNLIMVYAGLFDTFELVKPLASRDRNSEMYLVGRGFRGIDADTRGALADMLNSGTVRACIPRDVVADTGELAAALAAIKKFALETASRQRAYIEELIWAFETFMGGGDSDIVDAREGERELNKWVAPVRTRAQREWLVRYPLVRLDRSNWLPSRA